MTLFEVIMQIEAFGNAYKKQMTNFEKMSNLIVMTVGQIAGNKNHKWIDFYEKEKSPVESFIDYEDEEALEEVERLFS